MIKCNETNEFYIGSTNDLKDRERKHNKGTTCSSK